MIALSVPDLTVPLLLIIACVAFIVALAATPHVTRRVVIGDKMQAIIKDANYKRRIAPHVPIVLSLFGILFGLCVGALLATLILNWQGWLVGLALAVGGAIVPRIQYQNGWSTKFVKDVNADCLMLLQMVYILSGVGPKPVDEAMRSWAQAKAEDSQLALLLMECPSGVSPIAMLGELGIPGGALANLILTLRVVQTTPQNERRRLLQQRVDVGIAEMEHQMHILAKKRAQAAIICGVLILMPTLMLGILAPPLVQMAGIFFQGGF